MSFLHRIVAVILLALYAPGTVLAAMPLVLCTAADGHQKIELASHLGQVTHEHQAGDVDAGWHSHDAECDDRSVLRSESRRPQVAQLTISPIEASDDAAVDYEVGMQPPSREANTCSPSLLASQHLIQLRTVVLLI